jgi:hypothetical protein
MKLTERHLRKIIRETISDISAEFDKRNTLISMYSDTYKEIYGIRPHGVDFSSYTSADIKEELDDLRNNERYEEIGNDNEDY